ncbi:putative ABC transport system permease protein [Duganella sacchari]|uniref:Putative ABC transport system permease protein n=1 Tax=Duganella sacchari TaxID=551987 RepID=A0A1M7M736_9BURK|nr:ABC transporter permease [Duganella sacchari]SHM86455.1 putative ABC transport system permease protein [Duganella sacchari]
MMLRDFRLSWRLLLRYPVNTAVELLGLAAGFAVCFVLLAFVHYSFSYDSDIPQRDQVFLIKHRLNFIPLPQWMEYTPFAIREVAQQSGLPLQVSAWWPRKAVLEQNGSPREIEVTAVDPAFENIIGLRTLEGNLQQALTQPDGMALTQQAAWQLFGSTQVLGRTVILNRQPLQVRAILPDRPGNSTIQFGVLVGVNSALWPERERQQALSNWMGISGRVYVKTSANPQALQTVLQNTLDKAPWASLATAEMKAALGGRKMVDVALGPLSEAYFDRSVANTMGTGPRGDMRVVLALGAAGLLILLLAVVNYVNLATVRTLRRQREIAVRRTMGASTYQLLVQFMSEAMFLAVSAAALGVLLAWLLLPLASALLQRQLESVCTPLSVAACLGFGALVGAAAGLYPGWLARGMDMRATLAQRSGETTGGAWLRRVLSAVQFSAAMGMGSLALAMLWQTQFATAVPPGFDPAPLLVAELPQDAQEASMRAFQDALKQLHGIAAIANSNAIPGRDDHTGTRGSTTLQRADGSSVFMPVQFIGADFFKAYNLQALAGRLFDGRIDHAKADGEHHVVINQAAARALGWLSASDAVGQYIHGSQARIIGVAPDLRWYTLREPIGPMMYELVDTSPLLTLRLNGTHDAVASAVAAVWQRYFPAHPLALHPAASYYAQAYADDVRLAQLLACATAVILVLAACGIYVLAAHSVQRRAREIVLRKLHGAGRAAIAALVGREFATLTAVAALIALPLAWLAIARYLAPFAERSPLVGWAPVAALGLALLIVTAATARHTLSAMRMAPVAALRD